MTDLNIKNLSYIDNFKHSVVGNFINFSTRASRSEYWRFTAVTVVIGFVFTLLRFVLAIHSWDHLLIYYPLPILVLCFYRLLVLQFVVCMI